MKPPAVSNPYLYWGDPPPTPSPRLVWWLERIRQGWSPNRRIGGMGYDESAHWYGVYIWEWQNAIRPALEEATG